MFFKQKKIQIKNRFLLKLHLLFINAKRGKKFKVKNILDNVERQKLVNLDEVFYIFQTIHNSPAYLEKHKKDAFAMMRQLGFPSLFISQSSAETKWPELLQALGELVDNKTYNDEEIKAMNWQTKMQTHTK